MFYQCRRVPSASGQGHEGPLPRRRAAGRGVGPRFECGGSATTRSTADSLHNGIQEVSDLLTRAWIDSTPEVKSQVAIWLSLRAYGECSVKRREFIHELQDLSSMRSWKTFMMLDAMLVNHDSCAMSRSKDAPKHVSDQRDDSESDEQGQHRTRLALRLNDSPAPASLVTTRYADSPTPSTLTQYPRSTPHMQSEWGRSCDRGY